MVGKFVFYILILFHWISVPPRFVKRPEDKVANENQDLEFECEIYGKPEPKVTWLKNGEKITLSQYWQIVNR